MTEVTVTLSSDTVTDIVVQDLKSALDGLTGDVKTRKAGGFAIFEHDLAEDLAEIERHRAALKLVLEYYGEFDHDDI